MRFYVLNIYRYQSTFGCRSVDFGNSSDMYARYTTTVICNSIVQRSAQACGVAIEDSRPICADTCAEFAQSEAYITADKNLCSDPTLDLTKLIRADFTTCALPEEALSGECISGVENEPDNCGFANSTIGLCSYCGAGGINSTDTCCYSSNAEKRCEGIKLPSITATLSFSTPTASTSPTNTGSGSDPGSSVGSGSKGISGGAIAGIVIGSLVGVAALAAILFFCLRRMRHGGGSQQGSIFNQPSPARMGPNLPQTAQTPPQGYEVLPGGRIARMAALEGHSGDSPSHHNNGGSPSTRAMGAYVGDGKQSDNQSSSEFDDSPVQEMQFAGLQAPPSTSRRQGSLSSNSILGSDGPQSPGSAGFSSPLGVASHQSEQLPFFKDYYSQEDIHPNDKVAVLWAYQPRAGDEFSLERGDMLRVVGIWDDGWATGLMINERADEWEVRRHMQRDSGVSNTSGRRETSPEGHGEIKAFPLVCVCLPQHWRKTIEGDGSTDTGISALNAQLPAP